MWPCLPGETGQRKSGRTDCGSRINNSPSAHRSAIFLWWRNWHRMSGTMWYLSSCDIRSWILLWKPCGQIRRKILFLWVTMCRQERWRRHCRRKMSCLPLRSLPGMKHKVKITILSALGVLLVGSSVAYAYSQKGTLISQKTEELPDGNIYVEELYEIDQ